MNIRRAALAAAPALALAAAVLPLAGTAGATGLDGTTVASSSRDEDDPNWQKITDFFCADTPYATAFSADFYKEWGAAEDMTPMIFSEPPGVTVRKELFGTPDLNDRTRRGQCGLDDPATKEKYVVGLQNAAAHNQGYKPEYAGDVDKVDELYAARLQAFLDAVAAEQARRPQQEPATT
ncbi:hypothetical protein P8605_35960 [Streptomyces sp. T-3]|nr:hypothetical protein [Streptomyces sp. T-3]